MTDAAAATLPFAIAVALTTLPVVATIGILLGSGRASRGWLLTAGYAGALALLFLGATSGLLRLDLPPIDELGWVEAAAGAALLVIAASLALLRRHDRVPRLPWARRGVRHVGPTRAVLVGVQFALHPENLVLIAAAATRTAVLDGSGRVTASILFAVISVSTVAIPTAAYTIWGNRARPMLDRVHLWISAHAFRIATVLLVLVGAFLLGLGVWNLFFHG